MHECIYSYVSIVLAGGQIFIDFEHHHDFTEADVIHQNPNVLPGGVSRPIGCTARHKVAVIVPYRDRRAHLTELLSHLHPLLQRQQLDYRIYVVEQVGLPADVFIVSKRRDVGMRLEIDRCIS